MNECLLNSSCVAINRFDPGGAMGASGGCCTKNAINSFNGIPLSHKGTFYTRMPTTYRYNGYCLLTCPYPLVISSYYRVCVCVKKLFIIFFI
jgi:hypothetical protein